MDSIYALRTEGLTIQFGGLKAVCNLNLAVRKGSIFGLIGPNGAGKTTVFNLLTGVYQPTEGKVIYWGTQDTQGLKPYQITQCKVGRTFQNIRLFKGLSVLSNVLVSCDSHPQFSKHGFFASMFRLPAMEKTEQLKKDYALKLLSLFNLENRSDVLAKNLPYGDQRRLEIVRAMATGAEILMLDEPAAGMNPNETADLMKTIRRIRDEFGMTIVLIEHDMKLVMGICERIAVLDYGLKIAEGTASEIQKDSKVIEAYLGKGAAAHA